MSNSDPSRKFKPGPGWLLFFGMIAVFLFNKNSREVVQTLVERMKAETQRMNTQIDGLKSTLETRQQEGK